MLNVVMKLGNPAVYLFQVVNVGFTRKFKIAAAYSR